MIALVTGASQGIGAAVALRLAKEGYTVAVHSSNREESRQKAEQVAQQCRELGAEAACFAADVSDYAQCDKLIKDVKAAYGRLDVLVNNAGITRDNLILRMSEEQYDAVIASNQKSVFMLMKLAGSVMLRQKSGRIINMASVAGLYGNQGQVNYSASKAAVIAMTKSAAKELGARGITVNAVAPGFIETPMTDSMTDAQKESILSRITLGRTGKPEDVAAAVAFLAGEGGSYITGQVLEVSGGIVM
ncbi:3-oxoacyl-[acyl-carrier-protein] reductase [uncultured Ruminococcus sp.]|uniref:3-oxoacyl-[acyl-carrier-protein] reductase n=1 Tax=uncultured Ruminococcus sp. TaxID=165186 RepID=UPI0025FF16AA|nr:3-oxoacyl-[acyl-carrier-protein] reductase [uncultured Ruminococcus sp.]